MGQSLNIFLGFSFDQFDVFEKELTAVIDLEDQTINMPDGVLDNLLSAALKAREVALSQVGFTFDRKVKEYSIYHYIFKKESGEEIEFSDLRFDLQYSPSEMNDDKEHAIIGFCLPGWYGPHLIDCNEDDGGGYMTIFDEKTNDIIQLFKDELTKSFPVFAQARIIAKSIWN